MTTDEKKAAMTLAQAHRYALCRKALEAGIAHLKLGLPDEWWPELAPLNRAERQAVKKDLQDYDRKIVEAA